MSLRVLFTLVAALILCVGSAAPAWALASDWQKDDAVAVRLIAGVDAVGDSATVPLGIDVVLQPNWHTYWRSPGAAGLPPQIDWHNQAHPASSGNLASADLLYPAPKRYTAYGLDTVGYRDHVVFPIDAQLRAPGQPLDLAPTLSLLVCSDTCVPKTFDMKLTIPAGAAQPSAEAPLLKQFQDQVPPVMNASADDPALPAIKNIASNGDNLVFTVTVPDPAQPVDIFIEDDKDIAFTAPEIAASAGTSDKTLTVKPADALPDGTTLAGLHLTATLTNGDHSSENHVIVPAGPIPAKAVLALPTPSRAPLPLGIAIVFALIGGFILNLMPCVLPVLSLKLLSVISHGGRHARQVRYSFLATAAGILFSFLALAGITIALKLFGLSVGWGVQFQQPLFLTALILIVIFFAANMWGLFEINLPRFIADAAGKATHHPKLLGDFAAGAFATLLATPCTAPFLGTAIGFALAAGPREILIIFTALGCGMILPYLAIALFPHVAAALPRPGRWMLRLRFILGVILIATAVWLLWVLAAQLAPQTAAQVGLCMIATLLLLALRQKTNVRRYSRIGIVFLCLAAFGFVAAAAPAGKSETLPDSLWVPFNEAEIAADIAAGKTVFVDVTADWCLTCKANKKFVLLQSDIADRLFRSDIVAMQADWTNPDPAIAAFLQKYGRYGIPFNIVYGPGAPAGLTLPELLSKTAVTEALDKARRR